MCNTIVYFISWDVFGTMELHLANHDVIDSPTNPWHHQSSSHFRFSIKHQLWLSFSTSQTRKHLSYSYSSNHVYYIQYSTNRNPGRHKGNWGHCLWSNVRLSTFTYRDDLIIILFSSRARQEGDILQNQTVPSYLEEGKQIANEAKVSETPLTYGWNLKPSFIGSDSGCSNPWAWEVEYGQGNFFIVSLLNELLPDIEIPLGFLLVL